MNKNSIFSFLLTTALGVCGVAAHGQQKVSVPRMGAIADSLYKAKQFATATTYYYAVARQSDFPAKKVSAYYNMACCLSLQNKKDSALLILNNAITAGYSNKSHLLVDADFDVLHGLPGWTAAINRVKESKKAINYDPAKAGFITTDIHHFWQAYDKAVKDTAHFKQIMHKLYFDRASRGMNDYMDLKVGSIDEFVSHIQSAPKFYSAIRNNTFKIDKFKPAFEASYRKFKLLYGDARFPDVYFVIGAFTSGGTVSNAGLLLGVNQSAADSHTPVGELSARMQTRLNPVAGLPDVVAHELIHYQQDGMKQDTTTLSYVIREGMADFMGELISGRNASAKLAVWATGKEKRIWNKFTTDIYQNRYNNWIANSKQSGPDNPPDQGYWIGYQICKSYYEQATDKKQAIYNMLHIQDYKAFLMQSQWESKVAVLP
ncbi:TPR end-of-group domain-containing protein [Mucilaginibacter galii]|uniref:DUF2268 domain-containing protein n=1 Tax=Mucilaginibacter galii TaxID=2005073 RepID=A0A917JEU8_9SPHI|nr:DUF2268 domain-containing putative Zn-dependent protease [Mucilaginibacter galii]GGI52439.1 hypothetical protein GCM10011425_36510 [Mucilaginibacter galii]